MTLESKYKVPTVGLHTHVFERLVRSVTRLRGMPSARYAFVPMPVMGKTPEQLTKYIEGTDPVFGRPVFQEIIESLTLPVEIDEAEVSRLKFDRSTPRMTDLGSEEDLQDLFLENNW